MRIYSANSCTELSKTEIFPVSFANVGSKQKQEMLSRQQKSEKKGSERYLMFGPNHIFVIWDGVMDVSLVAKIYVGGSYIDTNT